MEPIVSITYSLGMMAIATMVYGGVQRRPWPKYQRHLVIGAAFGLTASAVMLEPLHVVPGVFADLRNLFIAFAAAFLGPLGAAVSVVIVSLARLAIGGVGASYGVIAIVFAAVVGLIAGALGMKHRGSSIRHAILFGVATTLPTTLVFSIPDTPVERAAIVVASLLAANILGSVTFGLLIQRERLIARRERLLTDTADHDPLTGCLNRRGLERRLEQQVPSARRGTAFLLIDIDRFKGINDTYGHNTGDDVLVQVAATLNAAVRPGDLIARLGGEEFTAILQNVTEREARRIAERLRRTIEQKVYIDAPEPLTVTASIGGAHFNHTVPEWREALTLIDRRLYAAKNSGRNRTVMSEAA
ncbi:GGDEF domain-containing protein [Pseudoroseicyclus tamaricis]|uniref:diguanylate cyclase n=1 Tax=Pseudoroseicyclus tamaricis TaxID=2705421 RepID=A0A6B2JVI5_9RHOB|nr:diguanylate cyclase [Pseudoroseicyclus tamaricis]NDU99391.1 diguanylate cyclase [Pseudoroseicyclus tamaricis]